MSEATAENIERFRSYKRKSWQSGGFVYVINRIGTDEYKIGIAINTGRRLAEIQTRALDKMVIVYQIETNHPRRLEEEIHLHFHDQRIKGEWFRLSARDIHCIRQIQDGHWGDCLLSLVMADYYGVDHHG